MNIYPFQDYSEHDVVNLFTLNTPTGAKGTPVVIATTGGYNSTQAILQTNTLPYNPSSNRYYSPRWSVQATVRAAVTGEKPFGVQLYDVKETTQFGTPAIYDPVWCAENQCSVSGWPVPILRKGMLLVGPFGTGDNQPNSVRWAAVKATGDWGVMETPSGGAVPTGAFGRFLGGKDSNGYALVDINCWI